MDKQPPNSLTPPPRLASIIAFLKSRPRRYWILTAVAGSIILILAITTALYSSRAPAVLSTPEPSTPTVAGTVHDNQGNPINGAIVATETDAVVTNISGAFALPAGQTDTLRIFAHGYEATTAVPGTEEITLTATAPGAVTITITDSTGQPLPAATITTLNPNTYAPINQTSTDQNGQATLNNLPSGLAAFIVQHIEHQPGWIETALGPGGSIEVSLQLNTRANPLSFFSVSPAYAQAQDSSNTADSDDLFFSNIDFDLYSRDCKQFCVPAGNSRAFTFIPTPRDGQVRDPVTIRTVKTSDLTHPVFDPDIYVMETSAFSLITHQAVTYLGSYRIDSRTGTLEVLPPGSGVPAAWWNLMQQRDREHAQQSTPTGAGLDFFSTFVWGVGELTHGASLPGSATDFVNIGFKMADEWTQILGQDNPTITIRQPNNSPSLHDTQFNVGLTINDSVTLIDHQPAAPLSNAASGTSQGVTLTSWGNYQFGSFHNPSIGVVLDNPRPIACCHPGDPTISSNTVPANDAAAVSPPTHDEVQALLDSLKGSDFTDPPGPDCLYRASTSDSTGRASWDCPTTPTPPSSEEVDFRYRPGATDPDNCFDKSWVETNQFLISLGKTRADVIASYRQRLQSEWDNTLKDQDRQAWGSAAAYIEPCIAELGAALDGAGSASSQTGSESSELKAREDDVGTHVFDGPSKPDTPFTESR